MGADGVRADGLLWIAIPCIAVGLWLAHDGFQSPAVVRSARRPSQLLLRLQDYLVQADLERWTPWRVLLLCVVSASFGGVLVGWAGWGLATIVAVLVGLVAPLLWIQARHGTVIRPDPSRVGHRSGATRGEPGRRPHHRARRARSGRGRPAAATAVLCSVLPRRDELDLQRAALRLRDGLADPVSDLFVAGLLLHIQLGGDDFRPMLAESGEDDPRPAIHPRSAGWDAYSAQVFGVHPARRPGFILVRSARGRRLCLRSSTHRTASSSSSCPPS